MICIKSIEVIEVDQINMEIMHHNPGAFQLLRDETVQALPEKIITEFIKGEEFTMPNGKTIRVGFSKQVQDALGLPMEVFESMSRTIIAMQRNKLSITSELYSYKGKLDEISNWSKWQRLKFLFTGNVGQ